MRRLALPLLGALALAAPASSTAATTSVSKAPIDIETIACNGDTIHLTGSLLTTTSFTSTPSGGQMFAFHSQPQGVSGVDEQTGATFHGSGLQRDVAHLLPSGGYVETFVNIFHIQATRSGDSFDIREVAHITVTPAQTVSVSFDNFSASC